MSIKLGYKVKDVITGFEGIVTARAEYLTGCVQFGVAQPVDKDGKLQETIYFDESRLQVTVAKSILELGKDDVPGGPNRDAPRR